MHFESLSFTVNVFFLYLGKMFFFDLATISLQFKVSMFENMFLHVGRIFSPSKKVFFCTVGMSKSFLYFKDKFFYSGRKIFCIFRKYTFLLEKFLYFEGIFFSKVHFFP